jgi:replication-associated recombination protein RarA
MTYQVLARRWRPQRFDDLVGQEVVVRSLRNALSSGQVAHAYLFSGLRGVGKTTVARLLAKALNCEKGPTADPCGVCATCVEIAAGSALDVLEMDAASNRGIDDVRELREVARVLPVRDRYRVFIVDEAHQLTDAAFNALLKILEEPPSAVHFILTAERAEELIPTIRSRLRAYRFQPRGTEEAREILARVFKEDNPAYDSLKSYFLAWEDISLEAVRSYARRFAEKLLERGPVVLRQEIPELFQRDAPRVLYRVFLEELTGVLGESLGRGEPARGAVPLTRCERWARLIRSRGREFFTLNISPALFIEGLFLSMKEEP